MKNRTIKLLQRLLVSDYPLSVEQLSQEFGVSSRTIRNDMQELNCYLEQNNLPQLKSLRNKGVIAEFNKKNGEVLKRVMRRDQFYYLTKEERVFDLILSIALGRNKVLLYQKIEAYGVSKSTIDQDMKVVRGLLSDYQIDVLSIPKKGMVLKGSERTIRTMIFDVINQTMQVVNIDSLINEPTRVQEILLKYISASDLLAIGKIYDTGVSQIKDMVYRNQFILFTAIWIARMIKGEKLVRQSSDHAHVVSKDEFYVFINEVINECSLDIEEAELNYILFMLRSFNPQNVNSSLEWIQAQMLSLRLIKHVEKSTSIPFSSKEEQLQEGLYKHMTGLLNRIKNNIQVSNPLKENIKQNYREIFQSIKSFCIEIEAILEKELIEDEIAFLTIHFSTVASELNQIIQYGYKAVVVCNHGTATGKLLSENLKELFNIEVIAVLSSKEVDVIEKLDVDVVFSTVSINYHVKPMLVLDPIIRKENKKFIEEFLKENKQFKRMISSPKKNTDLFTSILSIIEESGGKVSKQIYHLLEKHFEEHKLTINKRKIQPMLKDVLKKQDILLSEKVSNWEEAIKAVSNPLLKANVIEEKYIEAMIQGVKEYGPYIVIGKHLAIAHARPEDGVNELGISVATLKEPINFGSEINDPVRIIFCLAAVDSYSHLSIMKALVDLINDEEKIEKLIEAQSIKEFENILYKTGGKIDE